MVSLTVLESLFLRHRIENANLHAVPKLTTTPMSNRGSGESRLINEAKEFLGSHLVSFLMAGYDDLDIVYARWFEVLTQRHDLKTRKLIKISTGDSCGLPHGEEPLVLLALLKLLNSNSDLVEGSKVISPTEEVCSVLGWQISDHTSAIINRAIRKYYRASYMVAHDNKYSFGDMSGYSVDISRLIVAYAFNNEFGIEEPLAAIGFIQVEFNESLVAELRDASLLGMDWRYVTSLNSH
ncbi:MAG TPA: hypothetical protein VJ875_16215 [Pyrinomonadaceae bacterium]|nr:hypothetical protein [Pyrinomonadaceae bacterium]